ncbi:DedA family protein [Streptomyces marispadix]|uniref:VTT domain-containing protein n=1 Tax=Streptomyces marispadix TaxID=2922868 RepID=A0ABS9SZT5_9ACTN|nr:VTT domain-containing protein [Streptomyces marispadix]MCH6161793.1 VTT domain-containing protein [Streptomyces marispadix]
MESTHWIYAVLVLATMPPMVPNSALVAGAGAMAAAGRLSLPLLVAVLLVSTVTGDIGTFWAGRRSRGRALGWLCRTDARRTTLEWTAARFQRYGVASVIAVRFVPGGRGVGGLTAGVVGYPLRGYLLGAAVAEAIFVSYTVGLGYLGGRFALDGVARWLVGPAVSLLVAGLVLGGQRVRGRGRRGSTSVDSAGPASGIAGSGNSASGRPEPDGPASGRPEPDGPASRRQEPDSYASRRADRGSSQDLRSSDDLRSPLRPADELRPSDDPEPSEDPRPAPGAPRPGPAPEPPGPDFPDPVT